MTRNYERPAQYSVAGNRVEVPGYVEYWYWLNFYANPGEQGAMTKANFEGHFG